MTKEKQLVKGISNDHLRLMALELSVKLMAGTLERIDRRMERLDEVYYHIFPERLKQDMEFERQLHKLNCPPKRRFKKKKS